MTHLLKPRFSEEGSNERMLQNEVYGRVLKYMREAASMYIILLFLITITHELSFLQFSFSIFAQTEVD